MPPLALLLLGAGLFLLLLACASSRNRCTLEEEAMAASCEWPVSVEECLVVYCSAASGRCNKSTRGDVNAATALKSSAGVRMVAGGIARQLAAG